MSWEAGYGSDEENLSREPISKNDVRGGTCRCPEPTWGGHPIPSHVNLVGFKQCSRPTGPNGNRKRRTKATEVEGWRKSFNQTTHFATLSVVFLGFNWGTPRRMAGVQCVSSSLWGEAVGEEL